MLTLLIIITILGIETDEKLCIEFHADSNAVYQKEDGSGNIVDEKVYHLSKSKNGEVMFLLKGIKFIHDPKNHLTYRIENTNCNCDKILTVDGIEKYIEELQLVYPFGKAKNKDSTRMMMMLMNSDRSYQFYEVDWVYYIE